MAKRLIMCCDGTWNTAGQKCPTNVVKLYNAIAERSDDGTEQRRFYHPGVGTKKWERIRGGAFGFGLSRNVQDTYRFLVENYEPGDELFLFGFSRGAFTARSTAGFVRNAGILRSDQAHRIGEAYALYRTDEGPDSPAAVEFRKAYAYSDQTPIRFVGVWDTVGALGVPNVGFPGTNFLNRRWAFHDTKLSSRVQSAYQALAIDEQRRPFEPAVWIPQAHAVSQELEQVWFTGVHCDVGGGYPERDLADISYRWMANRACAAGLALTEDVPALDPTWAMGRLHESRTGLYKIIPPLHRALGKDDAAHEYASSTAVLRHKDDKYQPTNLVTYLDGTHQELPI